MELHWQENRKLTLFKVETQNTTQSFFPLFICEGSPLTETN